MAKRPKRIQKTQTRLEDMVVVTLAEDDEQAKEYEALLTSSDIPAIIKTTDADENSGPSISLMVPEEFLDEAHVIIESQNAYEEFYDFESDDDFDDDDFAEEF